MDCCFKVQSQSHVYKLVCYHQQFRHVYPEGLGEEAIELGPRSDKQGPCVVLFRGVTISPAALNAWLETSYIQYTVGRVLWVGCDEEHCAGSQEELLDKVARLAAGLDMAGGGVRLQCEPRSLERWLAENLPASVPLQLSRPSHILDVLHWPEGSSSGLAAAPYRFAMRPAAGLYRNSPTALPRVPDQPCKAAGKLAEALQVARFQPSSGVAIDVGAAPGGWTLFLAQRMQTVVAIDPAELSPSALLPNVTHLRCKAEEAVGRLTEMMLGLEGPGEGAAAGDALGAGSKPGCGSSGVCGKTGLSGAGAGMREDGGPGNEPAGSCGNGVCGRGGRWADLLVCDMNHHPSDMLPLLSRLLGFLRPGGLAILTLKFFGVGRDKSGWESKVREALAPLGCGDVQLVWLVANTVNERTCIARKGGSRVALPAAGPTDL